MKKDETKKDKPIKADLEFEELLEGLLKVKPPEKKKSKILFDSDYIDAIFKGDPKELITESKSISDFIKEYCFVDGIVVQYKFTPEILHKEKEKEKESDYVAKSERRLTIIKPESKQRVIYLQ